MANFKQHAGMGAVVGLITGAVISYKKQKNGRFSVLDFAADITLGAAAGLVGSAIPDILEPATNPNHRAFFHSYTAAIFSNSTIAYGWEREGVIKTAFCAGYCSHLALDAITPKSLPII